MKKILFTFCALVALKSGIFAQNSPLTIIETLQAEVELLKKNK